MADTSSAAQHDVIGFPGSRIRPIPSFAFQLPEHWVLEDAPDALALIRTPKEVDGFWVNAIISHDRVGKAVDLEAAAKLTWARQQESSPDAEAKMQKVVRFDDQVVYLRGTELKAPKSGRELAQLQAITFAPSADDAQTADMFQIVGTATTDVMERAAPKFLSVISSFQFT